MAAETVKRAYCACIHYHIDLSSPVFVSLVDTARLEGSQIEGAVDENNDEILSCNMVHEKTRAIFETRGA